MRKLDRPPGAFPQVAAGAGVLPDLKPNRTPLLIAALVAAVLAVGLFFVLRSSSGGLVVTVAGSGGQALDSVQVLVDDQVRCNASPCRLEDLPSGTHMIRARADGYQETADTAVLISGGQDAVHNIKLVQASGTGVRVSGEGPGLTLLVDGHEIGPLPQELKDLTPGEHKIRVQGEHFETYEQTVLVTPNEMQTIGPLRLKVTKGLAHIKAGNGADGAKVILETGSERRSLPSLPMDLQIDTSKPHRLVASKRGYRDYSESISFSDGEPEREFVIDLEPSGESEAAPSPAWHPHAGHSRTPSGGSDHASSSGQGTLSLNSIPASKVILDGRPLGDTPKVGVSVSPGSHTVMFVRDGERQAKSVTVGPGEKKTVVHRFK
jgi:serine/threonine-protein kinase